MANSAPCDAVESSPFLVILTGRALDSSQQDYEKCSSFQTSYSGPGLAFRRCIAMKVSHSIVLVPVILAGLARAGVCQVAADPFDPATTENGTEANEPGPAGRARFLIAAPTPQVKTWYGGKILAADAAMVATLVVAAGTKSTPLAAIGGVSYLVTPAVIHGVHGRGGLSVLSVVLRVALPIAGMAMGASMANCHPSNGGEDDDAFCGLGEAIIGGVLGVIAASAVDASLAWESAPNGSWQVQPQPRSTGTPPRISLLSPSVVPIANGASILLGGRF